MGEELNIIAKDWWFSLDVRERYRLCEKYIVVIGRFSSQRVDIYLAEHGL